MTESVDCWNYVYEFVDRENSENNFVSMEKESIPINLPLSAISVHPNLIDFILLIIRPHVTCPI